mmetsp:Transcript_67580/g.98826  ORF Transcript_67580/g.98826 Transcript_67580/m.98826 type:complete len:153 (+) Transcript_67580:158-616(+)|eukprot:CAMPEP_0179411290 /NCGR_PEP_ID=MMETSP0799-20121207/3816_1 /TAXON_ID=46947 /ORGANISM="Geminigera cryophila, Strain CCMP2564" /LENGTH=152 /DNA_ID=CAMNT_0021183345 /DNA_START=126 /DNA_END=584 /DNA_ORIENTATION=-
MSAAFGETSEVQKGEQKDYYANERNYIHWLHMGVTLGSVALMIGRIGKDEDSSSDHRLVSLIVSSILACIAICFAVYSLHTFFWRRQAMNAATVGQHANVDEPWGPLVLSAVLTIGLFLILLVGWTAPGPDIDPKQPTNAPGNYIPVHTVTF